MLKYLEMCFFLVFFLFYLLFGIHLCTFWSNCYLPAVTIIIKLYDIIFQRGQLGLLSVTYPCILHDADQE